MDMTDQEWNKYLTKYRSEYMTDVDEIGMVKIRCRDGNISPWGEIDGVFHLVCYLEKKTKRHITNLKKRLPDWCKITQEGDSDICFTFPELRLKNIAEASTVKPYKRRKYSEEYKCVLRKRIEKMCLKRHSYQGDRN